MGNEYDISAFIIPPPPTSDDKDNRSSDIIRRLYEAKEGISKVSVHKGLLIFYLHWFCYHYGLHISSLLAKSRCRYILSLPLPHPPLLTPLLQTSQNLLQHCSHCTDTFSGVCS